MVNPFLFIISKEYKKNIKISIILYSNGQRIAVLGYTKRDKGKNHFNKISLYAIFMLLIVLFTSVFFFVKMTKKKG